jgi:acyl-CoA synthetase (AMP-forming)/AMP-acid ligase II
MDVVFEREAVLDPTRLVRAWQAAASFVFVPDKAGVSRAWLDERLALVPAAHAEGCFALLTSGSTGLPKLVVGERRRAEALAAVVHAAQELADVRETIVALPLTYSYAFVNQWVWGHVHGRRLVLTRGVTDASLDRALADADAAMLCLVGAQVPMLAARLTGPYPGVRCVNFAGGAFPGDRLDDVRRLFPTARIYNNYGCAEAMPRLTVRRAEDHPDGAVVGRPLPGIEMMAGDAGEIRFRSPYGAVAFVDDAGATAIGPETWVASGDLGTVEPGGMWRLTGRATEVYKRYGEKIALPALAATVRDGWPGEAAFYRERDAAGEDGHVLVLAPVPDAEQVRGILKRFRQRHGRVHWPLRIESVAALPLSPNGKPDVHALAAAPDKTVHWQHHL